LKLFPDEVLDKLQEWRNNTIISVTKPIEEEVNKRDMIIQALQSQKDNAKRQVELGKYIVSLTTTILTVFGLSFTAYVVWSTKRFEYGGYSYIDLLTLFAGGVALLASLGILGRYVNGALDARMSRQTRLLEVALEDATEERIKLRTTLDAPRSTTSLEARFGYYSERRRRRLPA
jgi:hypothetical protein